MKTEVNSFFFQQLFLILPETISHSHYKEQRYYKSLRVKVAAGRHMLAESPFTVASSRLNINNLNITIEATTVYLNDSEYLVKLTLSISGVGLIIIIDEDDVLLVSSHQNLPVTFQSLIKMIYENESEWKEKQAENKNSSLKIKQLKERVKDHTNLTLTNSARGLEFFIAELSVEQVEELISCYNRIIER